MIGRFALITAIGLVAVACAAPTPTGPDASNAAISAARADGPYTLRLDLPKATWTEAEDLTGTGTLLLEPGAANGVSGSGELLGFSFAEVGGTRIIGPAFRADCAPHPLTADTPIATRLTKSGGWSDDQPDADFYRRFFTDPGIHLPAGEWDVSVVTDVFEGHGCDGPRHALQATVRIRVVAQP